MLLSALSRQIPPFLLRPVTPEHSRYAESPYNFPYMVPFYKVDFDRGLGVDLVTLAAMLGHSRIQMVLRYAHPTEEHQFAAMEKRQRYMAR